MIDPARTTLLVPAAALAVRLLAQAADPSSRAGPPIPGLPAGGWETLLQLVPQLAIAFALFLVVKYYDDKNSKERDRAEAQRQADQAQQQKDNDRRDESMQRMMAEFKGALAESNAQTEKHTAEIVAELKANSQLDRDMHGKSFDAVVALTRETIGQVGSIRELVAAAQRDIIELKDRQRSALPPPGGHDFPGPRNANDPR
jgi:DNA primase